MVFNRLQHLLTGMAGAILAALLLTVSAGAAIKPGARYASGSLTMEVKNASVSELLESIAGIAGIDVYVAKGFQPAGARLTMDIAAEPLEEVLKQVLHGYNYAAVYVKEGSDFRIATLRIYPEGGQAREMVPLFTGFRSPTSVGQERRGEAVTVEVNSGGNIVTRNNMMDRKGVLGPSDTEAPENTLLAALPSPSLAVQLQLEQDEAKRFAELLLLRRRVEASSDPQRKEALAMVYAGEVAKFEAFKRANLSKVEALKRINQFKEIKGGMYESLK